MRSKGDLEVKGRFWMAVFCIARGVDEGWSLLRFVESGIILFSPVYTLLFNKAFVVVKAYFEAFQGHQPDLYRYSSQNPS